MDMIKGRQFKWFSEELKNSTGINIYDYSFDRDKGYSWINDDEVNHFYNLDEMDMYKSKWLEKVED